MDIGNVSERILETNNTLWNHDVQQIREFYCAN